MSRINAMVLTLAVGSIIGTVLRPGIVEIAIVAIVVCGAANLYRRTRGRQVAQSV